MNSEPSNLEEIPVQFELGQRITTKRGYEGTYITRLMEKPVAIVILDGCTYSDSHWYDEVPLADITTPKFINMTHGVSITSGLIKCPRCTEWVHPNQTHTCSNFPITPLQLL